MSMSEDEKRLFTIAGVIAVVGLVIGLLFVSKKQEVNAFRQKQKKRGVSSRGRVSSIRDGMKNGKRKKRGGSRKAPASSK